MGLYSGYKTTKHKKWNVIISVQQIKKEVFETTKGVKELNTKIIGTKNRLIPNNSLIMLFKLRSEKNKINLFFLKNIKT